MPPIVMSGRPLPIESFAADSLGKGSVVMIARAAAEPWSAPSDRAATGSPAWTLSIGNATPMTPVDATSTCSTGRHGSASDSARR